ncbi:MAG: acetyl-CoA acetyltransferase [Natronomonas sp.]|jgi:acetyl-CoA acetyltransferase
MLMSDRDVAVVGVGQSDVGEFEGERVTDFGGRVVREALLDSAFSNDDIEEAYVGNVAGTAQDQTGSTPTISVWTTRAIGSQPRSSATS